MAHSSWPSTTIPPMFSGALDSVVRSASMAANLDGWVVTTWRAMASPEISWTGTNTHPNVNDTRKARRW